jgi:hypothetical protein
VRRRPHPPGRSTILTLTREQLIDRLRAHLVKLTDEDRPLCQVARELNIYCHGFGRFTSEELRREYAWLEKKAHHPLTRQELEERANQWQLATEAGDIQLAKRRGRTHTPGPDR